MGNIQMGVEISIISNTISGANFVSDGILILAVDVVVVDDVLEVVVSLLLSSSLSI